MFLYQMLATLVIGLMAMPVQAARQALVIGNDDYASVAKLQKAGNDAIAMARELKAAGFTVQFHRDLNYRAMVRTVETFTSGIRGGDEVVVFFAGHGVQIKNGAYLLPTDIEASTETEVQQTAYELSLLTEKLSDARAAFSLVMVDACRNNPLKSNGRTVGNLRGLSAIEPPKGQIVVYSASRGQMALDRLNDKDANPNSVFTREFIARMKRPGVRIQDLMNEVQDAVEALAATVQHEQRPALYNESRGNFYFFRPTTLQVAGERPAAAEADLQIEQQGWAAAQSGNTEAGYAAYLKEYPQGRYTAAARIAMASLRTKVSSHQPAQAPAMVVASPPATIIAGRTFKDCADCPEMVLIPAGSFYMGSPDSEKARGPDGREDPVREVRIGYAFALGKVELSRGEFARFVKASGYRMGTEKSPGCITWNGSRGESDASKSWRDPGFSQSDSHPVVCLSWNDAQAYLAWLNEQVPGKNFRLPTEAEWEYAARAGRGATRFPWGDDLSHTDVCHFANVMDKSGKARVAGVNWLTADCGDGHAYTAPGGSFKPNAFGLYDMHGNVWEWVQDIWHPNYQGAPIDGSAWIDGGDQAKRVRRGGAWVSDPGGVRSANRSRYAPDNRGSSTGMRIARSL